MALLYLDWFSVLFIANAVLQYWDKLLVSQEEVRALTVEVGMSVERVQRRYTWKNPTTLTLGQVAAEIDLLFRDALASSFRRCAYQSRQE